MRMESEELRNLPLHMQEQVGVALAEQMEQAAPVADVPSGIAAEAPAQPKTVGDFIRSLNNEELADYLVENQIEALYEMLKFMGDCMRDNVDEWKKKELELLNVELCPFE